MRATVFVLDALTCLLCAVLLLSAYRRVKSGLLLWSGLCFIGLTLSNGLVFVDLVMLPDVDLYILRLSVGIVSMALMLYGLIWESR